MKTESKLAAAIREGKFTITAEYAPHTGTSASVIEDNAAYLRDGIIAVNVADNHYGVAMSSLAASLGLLRAGIEPVYQVVTRDRNRIALQSDLLGACYLGIRNVLCLSGYHQALTGNVESANVYDIDSIQFVAMVKKMNEGILLDGTAIEGEFSMLVGAAANPFVKPLELNILRLRKKVAAGAEFIQTQAVFDIEAFTFWMQAVQKEGLDRKIAILAGVLPLVSADEAVRLKQKYTDLVIPEELISRLRSAGDSSAQLKEGLAIAAETISKIKSIPGLKGIHIMSGGNERLVAKLLSDAKSN